MDFFLMHRSGRVMRLETQFSRLNEHFNFSLYVPKNFSVSAYIVSINVFISIFEVTGYFQQVCYTGDFSIRFVITWMRTTIISVTTKRLENLNFIQN